MSEQPNLVEIRAKILACLERDLPQVSAELLAHRADELVPVIVERMEAASDGVAYLTMRDVICWDHGQPMAWNSPIKSSTRYIHPLIHQDLVEYDRNNK